MKLVYPTRNAHTPASPPVSTSSFLLPPPSYPRVLHTLHRSPTIKAFDTFLHVLFFRCSKSVPPSSTPSPPQPYASCSCLVPTSHQSKSSFSHARFFHSVLLFSNNILAIVPAAAYSATRGFFFLLRLTCFDLISSIFFSCTHTHTQQTYTHAHRTEAYTRSQIYQLFGRTFSKFADETAYFYLTTYSHLPPFLPFSLFAGSAFSAVLNIAIFSHERIFFHRQFLSCLHTCTTLPFFPFCIPYFTFLSYRIIHLLSHPPAIFHSLSRSVELSIFERRGGIIYSEMVY